MLGLNVAIVVFVLLGIISVSMIRKRAPFLGGIKPQKLQKMVNGFAMANGVSAVATAEPTVATAEPAVDTVEPTQGVQPAQRTHF